MVTDKSKRDMIAMMVIFAFSIILYFLLIPNYIPQRASVSGDIVFTSRTFPYIISVVLAVLSFFGIIKNTIVLVLNKKSDNDNTSEKKIDKRAKLKVLFTFVIILVYGVLFTKIGLIFSSLICLPLMLIAKGDKKVMHYLSVGIFCVVMYIVFRYILHIPLP